MMQILFGESDKVLVIHLSGSLRESAATALSERLRRLCRGRLKDSVVIDLTQCEHVCQQGLGALVGFRLAPELASRHVTLLSRAPNVQEWTKTLRLKEIFEIPEVS